MGKTKVDTIDKIIVVRCRGWITSRELYEPVNDAAEDFFNYGALRKAKKSFIFEDLAYFKSRGWKIQYIGKKSGRLHILDAEYLGEKPE